METKRDVFNELLMTPKIYGYKNWKERYENATPDDAPRLEPGEPASNNTRQQQIEDLARELFVHNQALDTDKCFQYAELFYSDTDERNKENDK